MPSSGSKATSCADGASYLSTLLWLGLVSALTLVAGCRGLAGYDPAGVDRGPETADGRVEDGRRVDSSGTDGSSPAGDGAEDGGSTVADGGSVEGGSASDGAPIGDGGKPSTPGLCVDGWCWHYPVIATHDLRAVWGRDPNNLVIAGDHGTLIERLKGIWRTARLEPGVSYRDVWGDSAGNVWLVGKPGKVLYRALGASWVEEPLPPAAASVGASGVWGDKNGRVWAVTPSLILVREASGTWQVQASMGNAKLVDIWGNKTDIIAFSADGPYWRGEVDKPYDAFVKDGGAFATDIEQGFIDDNGTISIAANKLLARGSSATGPPTAGAWHGVHGLQSGQNLWGAGEPGALRWFTTSWQPVAPADSGPAFYDVYAFGSDEAVACGARGVIVHRDQPGSFTATENAVLQQYRDATALAGGGVALVTASYLVHVIDTTGNKTGINLEPANLPSRIAGRQVNDLWVVGTLGVAHWDGVSWSKGYAGVPPGTVEDVWRSAAGEVWLAGGASGVYAKGPSEPSFTLTKAPPGVHYTAVAGLGSVVAVGSKTGVVRRRDTVNGSWTVLGGTTQPSGEIARLLVVDQTTLYALVRGWPTQTQLWRYDGVWQQLGQVGVKDLWASSPADIWVINTSGISHYDGKSWSLPQSITANTLLTIDGVGGRIFAAGDSSTVLRR